MGPQGRFRFCAKIKELLSFGTPWLTPWEPKHTFPGSSISRGSSLDLLAPQSFKRSSPPPNS